MLCDPVRFCDNVDVERDRRILARGGAGAEWRAAVDEDDCYSFVVIALWMAMGLGWV
jgi:hypothetical protein